MQGLGEGQVTLIGERRLDQFLSNTKVLETIFKISIWHLDAKFLEQIIFSEIVQKSHIIVPWKIFTRLHVFLYQKSCDVSLVDKFSDNLFVFLSDIFL